MIDSVVHQDARYERNHELRIKLIIRATSCMLRMKSRITHRGELFVHQDARYTLFGSIRIAYGFIVGWLAIIKKPILRKLKIGNQQNAYYKLAVSIISLEPTPRNHRQLLPQFSSQDD